LILVSHDRFFISKTANKIWEIEDHKIVEFKGNYKEWLEWKERMAKQKAAQPEAPKATKEEKKSAPTPTPAAATKPAESNAPIDKDLQKQIQKLQKALAQIEHNIDTLKKEKEALEVQMADPTIYTDVSKFQVIEKNYHDKNALIRSMNKEYEMAFNDLLILESK
jgi:ATP-binding cassette subfamily F protein 3